MMPNPTIPAAGEALPAEGQVILFHPSIAKLRDFVPLGIGLDYVPDGATFNRQNLATVRLAIALSNRTGPQLVEVFRGDGTELLKEILTQIDLVGEYFEDLLKILALTRTRLEVVADIAGIAINEDAEPA
jgi:hypothetical protein